MKKPSIISIIILFGLLFALSGCVEKPAEESVILGRDGIVISFEPGMPPTSIDEYEPFDIGVLMENKGTAKVEIGDAAVFVSGIVYSSYNLSDKKMTSDDAGQTNTIGLEGAYFEADRVIPGDSDVAQWIGLKYLPDITSGTISAPITAQSCYKYSTIARAPICLATRSAIRDATGTAICGIHGEKPVTNDAAPVLISKVTESTYGSDGFKAVIEVQNVGNGAVYDNKYETDCLPLQRRDLDKIYVDYVKLGATLFEDKECSWLIEGENKYIKLQDGINRFTCRKTGIAGVGISQEIMSIKLSYGYTETIKTSIDINAIV